MGRGPTKSLKSCREMMKDERRDQGISKNISITRLSERRTRRVDSERSLNSNIFSGLSAIIV
jgi:hypothetical protein